MDCPEGSGHLRGLFRRRRAACRARYRTCDPCELTPPRPARLRCDLQRRGGDEMTATDQDKGAVIVTGASRGIGAAIAERLAEDGYGVGVNYAADAEGAESVGSGIRANGRRADAVGADVRPQPGLGAIVG